MSIKRVLCKALPSPNQSTALDAAEAEHAVKVLRLRDGETVLAMNGQGSQARATLRTREGSARLEFVEPPRQAPRQECVALTLELAVLKGDAMSWAVEKTVELGVSCLAPLFSQYTVVKAREERGPEEFRTRWQKIADQSLKQCGRLQALEITLPQPLKQQLLDNPASEQQPRLWFDEQAPASQTLQHCLEQFQEVPSALRVLIGPEGGWSPEERDLLMNTAHCHRLSLGPLILRAETAALCSASLCVAYLREHSST